MQLSGDCGAEKYYTYGQRQETITKLKAQHEERRPGINGDEVLWFLRQLEAAEERDGRKKG
jgi:hypothetical protein